MEALATSLSSTLSAIRKHLGFWVGQGVLRENHNDTFTVIEKQTDNVRSHPTAG